MWPSAKIVAFADSSFHIMPGTKLSRYFYEESPWGSGPAGQGPGLETDVEVPDFDWRAPDAVARHISSFDGRVIIAYLACLDDSIVYSDRWLIGQFAKFNETLGSLASKSQQHNDTWQYMHNMHACAPKGSVYSYIQNCTSHFQTLNGYAADNPRMISAKKFAYNVVVGNAPDSDDPERTRFWFKQAVAPDGSDKCPSEVRRRRVVIPPAPESAGRGRGSTTAPSTGSPTVEEVSSGRCICNFACTLASLTVALY
eukprot:gnl/MRDRNA2_/MRDRNA2_86375_c0_seq1.p1 gnl/MRDRNA2_/MRDRNA2_86375_c0~~gnl/MRDRNA2_/MRDRNA2_86375_c0_seq1.p1  ORF type:complete len:294 (+),score=44.86 gnl/MRDRNA2_/MRDRNA2_86375_c0_seq1:118-882(+)